MRRDPVSALLPIALRHDGAPSEAGRAHRSVGVAMFADISGFTPMTERMARAGVDGVEVLSAFLTEAFGVLIDAVHDEGGDVWVLVGDALLASWDPPDGDLAAASRAAVRAADRALQQLEGISSPEGQRVAVRVGVASGTLEVGLIGDGAGPIPFLSGSAIDQLGALDAAGEQGQITVGQTVADDLEPALIERRAGGLAVVRTPPRPEVVSAAVARLSVAGIEPIPAAIRELAQAGSAAWASEFRELTAVFIDLSEVRDLPSSELGDTIAALQGLLRQHGTALDRLILDDKGLVLVCTYGLPGHRHGDDAVRAVRVARVMLRHLADEGIEARAGVAAGSAFCALVGTEARSQYLAIGEVMNRAARLMAGAGPSATLLVDRAVRDGAAGAFEFRSIGRRALKGISGVVELFVPEAERAAAAASALVLVGREAEQIVLDDAWRAVLADGASRVVAVQAEAGMGKSALVWSTIERWSAMPGVGVHIGTTSATESTPLRLWRSVAASLLGFVGSGELDRAQVSAVLDEREDLDGQDRSLLRVLLGLAGPGELSLRPEAIAPAVAALIGRLIDATDVQATAILLEDAHWADSVSWSVYRNLMSSQRGVLVLITARVVEGVDSWPGEHPMSSLVVDVELTGLRSDALAAIGAPAIGALRLGGRLSDLVADRTQGNPLFARELVRSLRDGGLLEVVQGTARLTASEAELDAAGIPATVQGALAGRIDQLHPHEQRTLKAASVIGRTFDLERLGVVVDDLDVAELADRLVGQHLVIDTGSGTYEFQHALVRDAAYSAMSYQHRRELNATLASWYERPDAPEPSPARLAHHWSEAAAPDRAIPYAVEAGHRSLATAAYAEGAGLFRRAIELGDAEGASVPVIDLASWHERLGFAEHSIGALDRAEDAHRRALALLGRSFPSDRMLPARLVGAAVAQVGHRTRARLRGQRDRPRDEAIEIATRSHEGLGQVFYMVEDPIRSAYTILALVNEGEKTTPTPELARGMVSMSVLCRFAGVGRYSDGYRRRGVELTGRFEDRSARAVSALYLGLQASTLGRWESAIEDLAWAANTFGELGEPRRALEASSLLGNAYFARGDIDQAAQAFERVYAGAVDIEHRWLEGVGLIERAMVALRREEVGLAVELLEAADRLSEDIGRSVAILGGGVRAQALLRSGDVRGARTGALTTLDRCRGARPAAVFVLEGYSALIEVVQDPRVETSAAQRRRASAQLRTLARAAPAARPRLAYHQGCIAMQADHARAARRHLERARSLARSMDMAYDEALAADALVLSAGAG